MKKSAKAYGLDLSVTGSSNNVKSAEKETVKTPHAKQRRFANALMNRKMKVGKRVKK